MTIKKFKLVLASNIEKEEQWLTEMSGKGFHFKKYTFGMYYFDKDKSKSYVYQTDFRRDADQGYFQLYEDAGWQYVENSMNLFHYFRTENEGRGVKKIYSDRESVKESYQRMMAFYLTIFSFIIISQVGLLVTWRGHIIQLVLSILVTVVVLLYVYLIFSLKRKINFYR